MKQKILLFTATRLWISVLLGFTGHSQAMWLGMSDSDLVEHSDIIVSGELIGHTRITLSGGGLMLSLGILRVEEVLKGDKDLEVILLEQPEPGPPQAGTDIPYRRGQRGLWFLRRRAPQDTGIYLADHPQRFLRNSSDNQDKMETVRRLIKRLHR